MFHLRCLFFSCLAAASIETPSSCRAIQQDVELSGLNLKHLANPSLDATVCCNACDALDSCVGWTLNKQQKMCWLKGEASASPRGGVISGTKAPNPAPMPVPSPPTPAPAPPSPHFHDTSSWMGAEYTPWRATNQMWWRNFSDYRTDVARELKLVKRAMGFTTLRVFLHDVLWDEDPEGLKANMAEFLSIADKEGMRVGFVFFDDCWDHARADILDACIPTKGIHNSCWVASPQDNKRQNGYDQFEAYVTGIISAFVEDPRVLWWEVFNEPGKKNAWSFGLRDAAYRWAKAADPRAPVISCWDDSNNTDIVDDHDYYVPSYKNSEKVHPVFSNPAKGGLVTEAGCRWYQGTDHDAASPLVFVNWLDALRRPESGAAFTPGAMLSWEVMVGRANTRWHWGDREGAPEPAVPWCGHVFPDGTPVSYTEAAAIRRYLGASDDFYFLDTFLGNSTFAPEAFLRLAPKWNCSITEDMGCYGHAPHARPLPRSVGQDGVDMTWEACVGWGKDAGLGVCAGEYGGQCWCGAQLGGGAQRLNESECAMPCAGDASEMCGGPYKMNVFRGDCSPAPAADSLRWDGWRPTSPPREALYELAVWPENSGNLTVTVGGCGVTLAADARTLGVAAAPGSATLATASVDGRLALASWNILRILSEEHRLRVWLNPTYADVTGDSLPPGDELAKPHGPAPLLDVALETTPGGLRAVAADGAWRIDYASVLPPTLFSEPEETEMAVYL